MAGALPACAAIVLVAAGTGGVPLSCPPDTICLQDYTKERFHRLTIVCRHLTMNLREGGHFFGRNVSYDDVRRCVTWRDGILSDCDVTEIDENGRRTDLPITYICTKDALTTPVTTPDPSSPPSSAPHGYTRRHTCAIAAVITVLFAFPLLVFLWFHMRALQRIYRLLSGHFHTIILHHSSSSGKDGWLSSNPRSV